MTIDPTELARLKAALHEWHAEALSQNANPLSSQLLSLFRIEADRNPVTRITDEAAYRILDEIEYSRAYMTIASQSVVLALIAELERLRIELARVSNVASERRAQLQTQTNLRVAAEERAGRKNVARLEAEVERLQAERDSLIGKLGDERSAHGRTQGSLALTEMDVEELRARLHQHEAAPIQVIAMGRKGEP